MVAQHRQAVLQGPDGAIYTLAANAVNGSNYGCGTKISKFSAAGALIKSVVIETDATNPAYCPSLAFLSNGNIVAGYVIGTSSAPLKFTILTPDLVTVVALTTVGTSASSGLGFGWGWQASNFVALDGGGFAVCFQKDSPASSQMLAIYDNAGTQVFNASIQTWTGTTERVYTRIAKLSNGNIAIVSRSKFTTTVGLYHGIYSPTGTQVKAMTQVDAGNVTAAQMSEIATLPGFYAFTQFENGNVKVYVFDNTGTLQGAAFSAATTNGFSLKLLTDGTQFLLLWANSNGSLMQLSKLPTTGSGYITYNITANTTQYNNWHDAFYENGFLVGVSSPGSGAVKPFIWSVYVSTGVLVANDVNAFGSAPTTASNWMAIIPGGDFSFICLYDYDLTNSTNKQNLLVGKYGNTAIIGSALAAAGVGTLVSVGQGAGAYAINTLKGTPSKVFDHTSGANIYGNKGAILKNGLVLRGM